MRVNLSIFRDAASDWRSTVKRQTDGKYMNRKFLAAVATILTLGGSAVSMGFVQALELAPFAILILGLGALVSARTRNESIQN